MVKALTELGLPHLISKIKALTDKNVISLSVNGGRITYTKQDGTKGIANISQLPIANGGTGATNKEDACKSLGALPLVGGAMSGIIKRNTDDQFLYLRGSDTVDSGAELRLYGKDNEFPGWFSLNANNGSEICRLTGKPNGTLEWKGKSVITSDTLPEVPEATTDKKGIVQLSDSTATDDSTKAATASAVKRTWDLATSANDAIQKLEGIPVGFVKFNPYSIIEDGWVNASLGTLTQRELYADLWAWVEKHPELLKTEAEWQAIEAANEGHVPFYSSGDGTTTFRLPKFLWYPCATDDTQKYGNFATDTQRNITGQFTTFRTSWDDGGTAELLFGASGAFNKIENSNVNDSIHQEATDRQQQTLIFDASRSVGADHTGEEVKPKTHYGCYVVKAYGTVSNTGNVDLQQVVSAHENCITKLEAYYSEVTSNYYSCPALFTPNKTNITIPKNLKVNIGDKIYVSTVDRTLELSTLSDTSVAGKDVYIYACQPTDATSTEPAFVLSLNSTVPSGYTANNSRKIGGFHCLCVAAGTLSNINPITGATETHTLSGYVAGDIIPASVWDLWHRPQGKQTEGMAYIEPVDVWMGIYGASWDGTKLVHTYGGVWADGASTKKWHGELSLEALIDQGMRLPWRHEFQIAAKGSNEGTNIQGSADPNTTGGHVDTAGRRMVSNYGLEDCAGALWQWLMDLGFAGGSGWTDSFYNSGVDPASYGKSYGTTYRLLAGGSWLSGTGCGSRSAVCDRASSSVLANSGCRGASEPLHRKNESRKAI